MKKVGLSVPWWLGNRGFLHGRSQCHSAAEPGEAWRHRRARDFGCAGLHHETAPGPRREFEKNIDRQIDQIDG